MKPTILITVLALVLAGCASNESQLASRAKVTRAQAEATALKKAPGGKVKEAELEEEHGKLVWSFDIARPGRRNLTEVHVDAITGKVVLTAIETPAQEAGEKAER
ncbi:MAG TPA: PepSY domain-containing protein [Chthoniobacteraceae bacterium]|nr:PepSY domain-containing protein [Chthoniobacteraceae bacterium]